MIPVSSDLLQLTQEGTNDSRHRALLFSKISTWYQHNLLWKMS